MRRVVQMVVSLLIMSAAVALAGGGAHWSGVEIPAGAAPVGSDACLDGHDDVGAAYAGGVHATAVSPAGVEHCEACHGPGSLHVQEDGGGFILGAEALSALDEERRVGMCVQCHAAQGARWPGGPHEGSGIACDACHADVNHFGGPVHPASDYRNPSEFCVQCHDAVVTDFRLPYRHRALEGEVVCGDCHDPHGDPAAASWDGLNEVCLDCHTEMAGPFVFAHDGATDEECTACHRPHGSSHDKLLVQSGNGLCLSCHHETAFAADDGWTLGGTAHAGVLANEARCWDCHIDVHGSNVSPTFRNQ